MLVVPGGKEAANLAASFQQCSKGQSRLPINALIVFAESEPPITGGSFFTDASYWPILLKNSVPLGFQAVSAKFRLLTRCFR